MALRIPKESSENTDRHRCNWIPLGSATNPLHYWRPHLFQFSPAGSWHQRFLAPSIALFSPKSQTCSSTSHFLTSFPWLQLTTQFLCSPSQQTLHTALTFSPPVVSEIYLTPSTSFYLLCHHQVQVNIISCLDNCSRLLSSPPVATLACLASILHGAAKCFESIN